MKNSSAGRSLLLANSIPKAGTHLLRKCLSMLPGAVDTGIHLDISMDAPTLNGLLNRCPSGGVVTAHLPCEPQYLGLLLAHAARSFLIVRDPRDLVVSLVHYVMATPDHYLHTRMQSIVDDHGRLMAAILGIKDTRVPWDTVALRDIGDLFRQFIAWEDQAEQCVVRYESLVGAEGGGNLDSQRREIARIARHAGCDLSPGELDRIASAAYDRSSATFRQGRIGEWRAHFRPTHVAAFKEVAGNILVDLGYEQSRDW